MARGGWSGCRKQLLPPAARSTRPALGSCATALQALCDAACLGHAITALRWEDTGGCCGGGASRLYAGSATGSIKLWDLEQGQGGRLALTYCSRFPLKARRRACSRSALPQVRHLRGAP